MFTLCMSRGHPPLPDPNQQNRKSILIVASDTLAKKHLAKIRRPQQHSETVATKIIKYTYTKKTLFTLFRRNVVVAIFFMNKAPVFPPSSCTLTLPARKNCPPNNCFARNLYDLTTSFVCRCYA